jgi:hypothetical protein
VEEEVVHCSRCGKPIPKAPVWLKDTVEFHCKYCGRGAGYPITPQASRALRKLVVQGEKNVFLERSNTKHE